MLRILIACGDENYTVGLSELLRPGFAVETCSSGKWAIELVNSFSPDIVVLDNRVTEYDCLSVIRMIRATGKSVYILLITNLLNNTVEKQLEMLGVDMAVMKPCRMQSLLGHIYNAREMIENPGCEWSVEQALDNVLLDLNFVPGPQRNRVIKQAVLAYYNSTRAQMKAVYQEVGKTNRTTKLSVEKALRDAIEAAWKNGDKQFWNLLFLNSAKRRGERPSNEEFCARISLYLQQRSSLKPAYKELPAKIN